MCDSLLVSHCFIFLDSQFFSLAHLLCQPPRDPWAKLSSCCLDLNNLQVGIGFDSTGCNPTTAIESNYLVNCSIDCLDPSTDLDWNSLIDSNYLMPIEHFSSSS